MDRSGDLAPWILLIGLGAFHGLNPAMGWLFAVSLGFQERRTGAVVKALGPIAAGHFLAIAAVAVPIALLNVVIPGNLVMFLGGAAMLGYAIYKVATRFRHPHWAGMRVTSIELVSWSALMAAAHGAGLMLIPALASLSSRESSVAAMDHPTGGDHAHHMSMATAQGDSGSELLVAIAAVSLHSLAMLCMMGLVAVLIYRWIGVGILRRAWINLDLIWNGALGAAGAITLAAAILPQL
jgi:hypothetical protein